MELFDEKKNQRVEKLENFLYVIKTKQEKQVGTCISFSGCIYIVEKL